MSSRAAAGPRGSPVPVIQDGDGCYFETFGYRHNAGVHRTESEIVVVVDEFDNPLPVGVGEVDALELSCVAASAVGPRRDSISQADSMRTGTDTANEPAWASSTAAQSRWRGSSRSTAPKRTPVSTRITARRSQTSLAALLAK